MTEKSTFEDKLNELQKIVDELEKGQAPLEEALSQFQRGVALSRQLQKQLTDAEKTLTQVVDQVGDQKDFERDNENE
jgi:exodeoxyribonuclease VII small subunit